MLTGMGFKPSEAERAVSTLGPRAASEPIEALLREALSEVLSEAGYPVQQAENGEVALARVGDEQPGIVLLDLKMPVLDGWGVMERMRGDAKSAAVPILILSAYGFEWEAELLGAQGYIPKSVGMEEILDRVRKSAGPPPMRH